MTDQPDIEGPDPLLEARDTSQPWRSAADVAALAAETEPVPDAEDEDEAPAASMSMTRAELDTLAEEHGVDTTSLATKADVVAAIEEAGS